MTASGFRLNHHRQRSDDSLLLRIDSGEAWPVASERQRESRGRDRLETPNPVRKGRPAKILARYSPIKNPPLKTAVVRNGGTMSATGAFNPNVARLRC